MFISTPQFNNTPSFLQSIENFSQMHEEFLGLNKVEKDW